VSRLKAAQAPEAPPRPSYMSSDNTQIQLQFSRTFDDGGDQVINYQLGVG